MGDGKITAIFDIHGFRRTEKIEKATQHYLWSFVKKNFQPVNWKFKLHKIKDGVAYYRYDSLNK